MKFRMDDHEELLILHNVKRVGRMRRPRTQGQGLLDSDKEQVNAQNKFGLASRFGQFLPQSQGTVNMCKGSI